MTEPETTLLGPKGKDHSHGLLGSASPRPALTHSTMQFLLSVVARLAINAPLKEFGVNRAIRATLVAA